MPKLAEIKVIDGAVWVKVLMDLEKPEPITLYTQEEVQALRLAERDHIIHIIRNLDRVAIAYDD